MARKLRAVRLGRPPQGSWRGHLKVSGSVNALAVLWRSSCLCGLLRQLGDVGELAPAPVTLVL